MRLNSQTLGKIDLTFIAISAFLDRIKRAEDSQEHRNAIETLADDIVDIWEYSTVLKDMQWKDLYNRNCSFELVKVEEEPDEPVSYLVDVTQLTDMTDDRKIMLTALCKSMNKWWDVAHGKMEDKSAQNCALCQVYSDDECSGCPVKTYTGHEGCMESPYADWCSYWDNNVDGDGPWIISEGKHKDALFRLAMDEYNFLEDIREAVLKGDI